MHLKCIASALSISAAMLAAPAANATFITGSVTLGGGLIDGPTPALPNLPFSLVSALSAFLLNPAAAVTGAGTGDYSPLTYFSLGAANSFTYGSIANPPMFAFGNFTFSSLAFGPQVVTPFACFNGLCNDAINFNVTGVVRDATNAFADSSFLMKFSANGTCVADGTVCAANAQTVGYTASISSTGSSPIPEPGTLALAGLALAGLTVGARRRAAK